MEQYNDFRNALLREINIPLAFREQFYEQSGKSINVSKEEYMEGVSQMSNFKSLVYKQLQNSKVFMLKDNISQMLYITDNKIHRRNCPFDSFFINASFVLEDRTTLIKGILIFKEPTKNFYICNIRIIPKNLPPSFMQFDTFMTNADVLRVENKYIDNLAKQGDKVGIGIIKSKKLQTFICNFLDFLNNPEVELVTVERTKEQNEKRILRGKQPIPPQIFVRVTGKLKIYVDELQSGGHFNYSHRFWVRGHFRTLRNEERYKDKVGTKIWIVPYVKGQGILINKPYEVSGKSQHTE